VSGPIEPFDGDQDDGSGELPWPQREAEALTPPGGTSSAEIDADAGANADAAPLEDPGAVGATASSTGTSAAAAEADEPESRTGRRAARSARVRRRRRILLGIGGSLVVIVLAFVVWYELESHAFGSPGPQVVVTVQQGESTSSVISALSQQHVIGSSLAFQISEVVHGTPMVLPGSYALHQNLSFSEVRQLLAAGPNIYPVNVRPGFTLSEVAQEVDSVPGHSTGGFEKTAASGVVHSSVSPPGSDNLEGMLGTGIYNILPGESDTTILTDMVQRFDDDAQTAGLTVASANALGMTPYQVLTVASIVEKEGYIPVNMPDTSRVIYNRLAQGTPLQMDSTVLYALGQDGGPVTSQDLKIQSPYNTYLNTGLTPTPICMPSMDALRAAVDPPAGAWLYFVLVQKNGVMAFSDTYAEQLANEQIAKARGLP
jgi:UPF0755 protein